MKFTFIDLFAGIGGFRLGLEPLGGRCVFTSEWDKHAEATYRANHDVNHPFAGDITAVNAEDIPDHDFLCGGFPCQPFSMAGRRKGFEDPTQGTLFFDVARIIDAKRPGMFLLENVPGLQTHDGGRTLRIILRKLATELGYHIRIGIVDAVHWVPQRRKRLFIAGFREATDFDFEAIAKPESGGVLGDILETDVAAKYTLSDEQCCSMSRRKGSISEAHVIYHTDISPTITAKHANNPGSGSGIFLHQLQDNPRRLTVVEIAGLMGFPDGFSRIGSPTALRKQLGNSVVPAVINAIAAEMLRYTDKLGTPTGTQTVGRQICLTA